MNQDLTKNKSKGATSAQMSGLRTGAEGGSRSAAYLPKPVLSSELNRMLSAAVVSVGFRRLLLSDAVAALATGYDGEHFNLRPDERLQVLAIRAGTLAEFSAQLLERLWYYRLDESRQSKQELPVNGVSQTVYASTPADAHSGGPWVC